MLLIEQHHLVGGCATQFKRKGYRFEVSLHELNGLDINEHLYKMYKDLNAFENLTFLKIPEFYRWIRSDMDIIDPDDADQARKVSINKFPHEEKGIDRYFKYIFKIRNELFRLSENKVIEKLLTPIIPFIFPNVVFNIKKTVGDFPVFIKAPCGEFAEGGSGARSITLKLTAVRGIQAERCIVLKKQRKWIRRV